MTDFDLFQQWLQKLKDRIENKKQFGPKKNSASLIGKRYLHFDHPVTKQEAEESFEFLSDAKKISRHTFYPFIKLVISRKRYLTDKITRARVRHPEGPKDRPICYASHHDSLIFSWYAHKIDYLLEKEIRQLGLDECVLAYRSTGLNNVKFAKNVFDYVSSKKDCAVLAFDVSKFFDTINHKYLKESWVALLQEEHLPQDHYNIFKAMTKFRFVSIKNIQAHLSKEKVEYCEKIGRYFYPEDFRKYLAPLQETNPDAFEDKKFGIPQGSPLSAVLSNMYMMTMDLQLNYFANSVGGIYRRYCDDLLLVVPANHMANAECLVENEFVRLQLKVNSKKTERRFFTPYDDRLKCVDEFGNQASLQYLGLEYDGKNVRIRPASLTRYHQRMKKDIRSAVRKALGKKTTAKIKEQVFKRTLYEKYTHLGSSNFISYVHDAYKHTSSLAIKKQVNGSVERVNFYVRQELIRQTSWRIDKDRLIMEDKSEKSAPSARINRMNFDIL